MTYEEFGSAVAAEALRRLPGEGTDSAIDFQGWFCHPLHGRKRNCLVSVRLCSTPVGAFFEPKVCMWLLVTNHLGLRPKRL